jgi:putative membrane protein
VGEWTVAPGPLVALLAAATMYARGVLALKRRERAWSGFRVASFGGGLAVIALALLSPLATHDENFAVHAAQHILLSMFAPLLLAFGAPVTLALRTLRAAPRRGLVRVLHSRPGRVLGHPVTAAVLFTAGLAVLYMTPLYGETLRYPLLHELMHVHFLLSGCLFAWVFVGVDPLPRQGSFALRVGLLALALGSHAALSKLIYAGLADPALATSGVAVLHTGAKLMYYAGDAADVVVLVAFFRRWYRESGRRLQATRSIVAST